MKLLFTADLHINLTKKNVPLEWQTRRYVELFKLLANIPCDLIVLGGDIFDRAPNIKELALYFKMLYILRSRELVIFDGNHEATKRGETFLTDLKDVSSIVHPHCTVATEELSYKGLDIIPYCQLKKSKFTRTNRILLTHVRGEIPPHVKAEIDLALLDKWDIVLAGDLHSNSNSQRNIVYPGSPLTVAFHRKPVDTGVITIDTDTLDYEFVELELPQLLRKKVNSVDEIVKTNYDHTIYELIGDAETLGKVKKSDLIDKKITNRDTNTATVSFANMSMDEELDTYLREVIMLEDESRERIMGVHNDYSA